jgi:hypothetical protein
MAMEPEPEPEPQSEPEPAPKSQPARRRARPSAVPVPANAQTSDTHPIRVSWVTDDRGGGRLGLCFCPGKQIVKSRLRAGHEESGRPIMRDLTQDLQRLRGMGIRQCETSQPRAVLDCSTRRTP